jgi:hypothetical protein
MSISINKLINKFEPSEKPRILILFGYGAWTRDTYEHVWNLDMRHGTCMNIYETDMAHGTFWHGAWTWDMYEHVWNLNMGHFDTWHGQAACMKLRHGVYLCDFCYRLMVMVGVWCQTCGVMFRWWTSTFFVWNFWKTLVMVLQWGNVGE